MTDLEKTEPKTFGLGKRNQSATDWTRREKQTWTVELPEENEAVRSAFGVFVSYIEIYNDRVFDLLQTSNDGPGPKK